MCKIMVMAGIKSETRTKAWEFIKAMGEKMSPGNMDGLGYAALSETGELFGERWHNNNEAFKIREVSRTKSELEKKLISDFKDAINVPLPPPRYNKFGTLQPDSIIAVTLHTRMATSGKQFFNTHPFVSEGVSLIHNGVIRNVSSQDLIQSTCDSEKILNLYNKHKVKTNPEAIKQVSEKLLGYFACGVLSSNKKTGAYVDVFKCDDARLTAAYIKEFETLVFSTSIADIKEVAEKLNLTVVSEFVFSDGRFVRLNAFTGECVFSTSFKKKEEKEIAIQSHETNDWYEKFGQANQAYYSGVKRKK